MDLRVVCVCVWFVRACVWFVRACVWGLGGGDIKVSYAFVFDLFLSYLVLSCDRLDYGLVPGVCRMRCKI